MKLIHKGKVKDVYEGSDSEDLNSKERLIFVFSDRISAFDVIMNQEIPEKGNILCKFTDFWFKHLNVSNHMIRVIDQNKLLVEKLTMIPIECIVRGYFYGSLVERFNHPNKTKSNHARSILPPNFNPVLASKLSYPIFDPSTKSHDHDVEISKKQIISSNILSEKDFEYIKDKSISLYNQMNKIIENSGFIISDVKFEFGFNKRGDIILGDSVGPDEFRLWKKDLYQEGQIQDSYDKQLLRDWLIQIGYKKQVDEFAIKGKKPEPPILPGDLINKISQRYIFAYEKLTGQKYNDQLPTSDY